MSEQPQAPVPAPAPSVPPAPPQGAPVPGQAVTSEPIPPPEAARKASHLTLWLEEHIAPEVADLKMAMGKVRELVPHLQALAGVVETLARMPGVSSQVAADAGEAAAEVARIAGELAAAGI